MITKGFVNQWSRSFCHHAFFAVPSADQIEQIEMTQMANTLGVTDENVLRQLQALGFTSRTVRLLWLLPSLQVAWADGYVSLREGELLLRAACSRAAVSDLSAKTLLQQWLEQHPSDAFFYQALHSIHGILGTISAADRALLKEDLLAHCVEIAAAARHRNGLQPRNTASENAVISKIAAAL